MASLKVFIFIKCVYIRKGVLNTFMIYGYARVSSKEQTLERQLKILKEKGVDMANIFKEFASGKSFKNRIEYERLLEKCKVGDTIYFASLEYSRNYKATRNTRKQRYKSSFYCRGNKYRNARGSKVNNFYIFVGSRARKGADKRKTKTRI